MLNLIIARPVLVIEALIKLLDRLCFRKRYHLILFIECLIIICDISVKAKKKKNRAALYCKRT